MGGLVYALITKTGCPDCISDDLRDRDSCWSQRLCVGKDVGNTNRTNLAPAASSFIATHHHRRRHPHPLNTQLDQFSMARTKVRNIHSTHQSLSFSLPTLQQTARKSTGGPSLPSYLAHLLLPFTLQAR